MSIKKNFTYSSILTISGYLFPFITFPYISRVLGVSNIGLCNFIDSIINYFIMFSMMGISTVGIREIASKQNNQQLLNQTFSSLFALCSIATTLVLGVLILCIFFVPQFSPHKNLLFIGVFKIIFNLFNIEWFFKGIEDFKYITIRSLFVKFIFIASIFIFIKDENDYIVYYAISTLTVFVSAVINWKHKNKYSNFYFNNLNIKNYVYPFITMGIYSLLTSMYTSFNVTYLGFVANNTEVGYYTTATKLYTIFLSLFSAFTGVMLPKMSSLVAQNNFQQIRSITSKSFNVLYTFSIPIIIGTTIFSSSGNEIIAGQEYQGAIIPMMIVMPLLVIIGAEQILVIQLLMPLKQDKTILKNSIIGAVCGTILNVLLVSQYQSIGSAIVWVCSEIIVLICSQYAIYKKLQISIFNKHLVTNIISGIPIAIILLILKQYMHTTAFFTLATACIISFIYYFIVYYKINKNTIIIDFVNSIKEKIDRR